MSESIEKEKEKDEEPGLFITEEKDLNDNIADYEKQKREKPAQERCEKELTILEKQLSTLICVRDTGLHRDDTIQKQVEKMKDEIDEKKKELKRKRQLASYAKECRKKKKQAVEKICNTFPEANAILKIRNKIGRPTVEENQPLLHQTILDIAMHGSGADERRRSEVVRSVRTLDDLHAALLKEGFVLSRLVKFKKRIMLFVKNRIGRKQ